MQNFIIKDYFELYYKYDTFAGIITDIPYKGAIKKKLQEDKFDFKDFFMKTEFETPKDSFLITFCNMRCLIDLINYSKETDWKFHSYQIWNKEPTRNWISWTYPLRTCEFIVYFKKGNFKFSFKDGTEKPAYKRSSMRGSLVDVKSKEIKKSFGMYSEIVTFKNPRNKRHPTEKPTEFSDMFKQIVGDVYVCDPFAGTGNLVKTFTNSVCIDIKKY